jgi:paraquat-inducible protein B
LLADAEGLQVGQSQLKFKDIILGTVKSLEFTKDRRRVLVSIATTAQAEPFLTSGTQFWVDRYVEITPERVVGVGHQVFQNTKEMVQTLVSKGLRASLQSANLLTREMLVSLEVVPAAPAAIVRCETGHLSSQPQSLEDFQVWRPRQGTCCARSMPFLLPALAKV